jgi:phosphoesterase RecJ-like protein
VSKEIAEAVGRVGNFVLATHIRPDGDALGSLLALAYILEGMGKQVLCYLEEPLPEMYGFLPCTCRVETDFEQVDAFVRSCDENVMGICLDCGDLQRLGRNGSALTGIRPFAVIDHHQGNSGFGDLAWIEPHRSSTGEMVFDLARTLGAVVSRDAAACLYTAIVTDTGSFQYDNASSHTLPWPAGWSNSVPNRPGLPGICTIMRALAAYDSCKWSSPLWKPMSMTRLP